MTRVNRSDEPYDSELPSYDDVIKEDANKIQNSYAPSPGRTGTSHSSYVPPPNPRPRPRPPAHVKPPTSVPTPQRSQLPWTYPTGFRCPKCNNTGYKVKNGRSCKSCWRRFAPVNKVNSMQAGGRSSYLSPSLPMFGSSRFGTGPPFGMGLGMAPPPVMGSQQPIVVKPGDPRLGGVLCGECRGTGRVSFILDEDICPLCRGIGRIIT